MLGGNTLNRPVFYMIRVTLIIVATHLVTSCTSTSTDGVEIRRTTYGVVHIKAKNYFDLAYGISYAYSQDNFCLLARQIVTVNGQRSMYFGPDEKSPLNDYDPLSNLESDFIYKFYMDPNTLSTRYQAVSAEAKSLISGYVAGYNRFIDEKRLPEPCKKKAWVRKMTVDDMYLMLEDYAVLFGGLMLSKVLLSATPPGTKIDKTTSERETINNEREASTTAASLGSNGWAFGRETTKNGGGILLANPHYYWNSPRRFYQLHLTIPGELDVMGATLAPYPGLVIGFNITQSWTHTVTRGIRLNLFDLTLDADNPLSYTGDGERKTI